MDLTVFVKGCEKRWTFHVAGTKETLDALRADGFVVDELLNVAPKWAPFKLWCWLQDVFRFRRP